MNVSSALYLFLPFLFAWTSNDQQLINHSYSGNPTMNITDIEDRFYACLERGDLVQPVEDCAYNWYRNYLDQTHDEELARALKRTLIAKLVATADQALTAYFEQEGAFLVSIELLNAEQMQAYYSTPAELMEPEHYLYTSLSAKALFSAALSARYEGKEDNVLAKEMLLQSIDLDPYASYVHNELGHIYSAESNLTMAMHHFREATKWNAGWTIPKENLQSIASQLHQSPEK